MEYETEHRKIFPTTLVVKAIGSVEQLQIFIKDLPKLYPRENITYSHIIKNRGNPGFHIFINIVLPSSNEKRSKVG